MTAGIETLTLVHRSMNEQTKHVETLIDHCRFQQDSGYVKGAMPEKKKVIQ